MLRYFRSGGVAQILVGGIVAAIIVVFVLEFRSGNSAQTGSLQEQCAVRYAGYCVNAKEYAAAFGLIVPRGVDPKRVRSEGWRAKVLDGLVERELLVEQAKQLKLGVSDEDLTRELESWRAHVSLPAGEIEELSARLGLCPTDGRGCLPGADRGVRSLRARRTGDEPFDYKLYEREIRIVANRGPKEFREMQERELLAARLRNLVQSRVRVSEGEVAFLAERAVIRSAQVNRSWFAKYALDLSDAAIDRWSFEHKAQVDAAWAEEQKNWTANCPLVREIVVPLPEIQVDDDKEPLKNQAEAARDRVRGGENFATVAREVSVADSAILGGSVGCLSKSYGIGADELLKAVEGQKPGLLPEVIETPRGYHVVELVGRTDEATLEQAGRRQLGLELYVRFAADEAAKRFAEKLVERVKAGEKLEDAVRVMADEVVAERSLAGGAGKKAAASGAALLASDRPKFEVSQSFGRSDNPLPELSPKEALAQKAFELAEPDAVYERPLETETGWVVIQLKERASAEELEKNKAELREALAAAKAADALALYVAGLKSSAGSKLVVDKSFAAEAAKPIEE
jgi:parvulin-like peptidyl-prolyl isomerase